MSSPASSKGRDDIDNVQEEWAETSSRSQVPLWLPISAFVGTSLALAIPMLMVRRSRNMVSKVGINAFKNAPPPPRRTMGVSGASAESTTARLKSLAASPAGPVSFKESSSENESVGVGSMMSAMSKLNLSNAMFAGKAFAIATTLVTIGGFTLAWGVKTMMGVNDAREFGIKVRTWLWSSWPGLTNSINRAPEDAEERQASHKVAAYGVDSNWQWEEAEKRLQRAYDEGGVPLWAQTALREMEAEARVERAKRQAEIDASLQNTNS